MKNVAPLQSLLSHCLVTVTVTVTDTIQPTFQLPASSYLWK